MRSEIDGDSMGKKDTVHIQLDATLRSLLEKIDEYVEDESHRYAIAIEGAWGSGKTMFIEQTVREHLEQRKIDLIRVSMFGLTNADQLYERIVLTILHATTENTRWRAIKSAKRMGMSTLPSLVSYLDSKGWKFDGSTSMQAIAEFVLSKKKLLVLDDVERRAEQSDEQSLFGAVNNLVEEYGVKVCLVSNSFSKENKQNQETGNTETVRQFDKDIQEKLVWKILAFQQSPSSLARSVFADIAESVDEIDCVSIICDAAEQAKCTNARAMIRADALIRQFCTLQTLHDKSIPLQNRKNAFRDAIQLTLLVCMGKPMEADDESIEKTTIPSFIVSLDDKIREKRANFHEIVDYYKSINTLSRVDLDNGFRQYLYKYYPDDEAGIAIKKIGRLIESAAEYDDEDIIPYIQEFQQMIFCKKTKIAQLSDIISIYINIVSVGFDCGPSEEDVVVECKRMIDDNPEEALNDFRHLDFFFKDNKALKKIVTKLRAYAEKVFYDGLDLPIKSGDDFNMSADELVQRLSLSSKRSVKLLTDTQPALIAKLFASSKAKEQMSIVGFFRSFTPPPDWNEDEGLLRRWLESVRSKVQCTEITSKMGQLRKRWLVDGITSEISDLPE